MNTCLPLAFFTLAVLLFPLAAAAQDQAPDDQETDLVTITFIAHVPADTPLDDTVYVCGTLPTLGQWDGEGLALNRDEDGTYRGSFTITQGTPVEYKLTRGSWETVEKDANGGEVQNRFLDAVQSQTVDLTVASWATPQPRKQIESTLTGNIKLHKKFHSDLLDNDRDIIVYLPPGYDDHPDRKYPVLYMHDGQNIFDAATSFAGDEWRVDEAAQKLIKQGVIEPIIIVGIYNTPDRRDEYDPGVGPAEGTKYTRFVVEQVMPFIEKTYRVDTDRDKTAIAGSSLGGLISLYMARAHADVFGRCGVVSPALGYQEHRFLDSVQAEDKDWLKHVRLWVDMGTAEASVSSGNLALRHVHDLVAILDQAGLKRGVDYQYMQVDGGRHNERAWADRIEPILTFLYGQ